jgi:hypothetical protein
VTNLDPERTVRCHACEGHVRPSIGAAVWIDLVPISYGEIGEIIGAVVPVMMAVETVSVPRRRFLNV